MTNSSDTRDAVVTTAVVNDYEVIVRGVAAMLDGHDAIAVVELASDLPVSTPVDVALYDTFAMPSITESEIDEILASDHVGTVVLYTWRASPDLVTEARRRGLGGVIVKGEPVNRLADLVVRAKTGEFVTSHELTKGPPKGEPASRAWPGKEEGLTAREAEVVGLIAQGLSNQDIADRMFISINSVKTYVRSAYRTMGVSSRSQAVLWGIEHGLAPERVRVLRNPDAVH